MDIVSYSLEDEPQRRRPACPQKLPSKTEVSGCWKAMGLGMPPQCVLPDHCRCRKHWHDRGIATDINMGRQREISGIGGVAAEAPSSAASVPVARKR